MVILNTQPLLKYVVLFITLKCFVRKKSYHENITTKCNEKHVKIPPYPSASLECVKLPRRQRG